jgi:uncharacterized FlaG/YvyC family protein
MTDPVSSISSMAATSQKAALAAVQSQLTAENSRVPGPASVQAAAASKDAPAVAKPSGGAAQAAGKPSSGELKAATRKLQDYFAPEQNVTLQVDHDSGESFVKIVDAKSKQLILQIPSKEVMAMAQKLREAANPQSTSGVLVDKEG